MPAEDSWNMQQGEEWLRLMGEVQSDIQALRNDSAALPLRQGDSGGGGGSVPRIVAALPPIPASYDVVTWASSDYITDGTGDNQVWECDGRVGQTEWTTRQFSTSKSGVPVEEEE